MIPADGGTAEENETPMLALPTRRTLPASAMLASSLLVIIHLQGGRHGPAAAEDGRGAVLLRHASRRGGVVKVRGADYDLAHRRRLSGSGGGSTSTQRTRPSGERLLRWAR